MIYQKECSKQIRARNRTLCSVGAYPVQKPRCHKSEICADRKQKVRHHKSEICADRKQKVRRHKSEICADRF